MTSRFPPAGQLVGVVLCIGAVLLPPFLGACFCSPSPPQTRGCGDPITDFSGITSMRVVEARVVRGPQGGRHIQFQVEAEGTGLRSCVAVRHDIHLPTEGPALTGPEVGVASDVSGSRVVTTPVYSFLRDFPEERGARTITVQALGRVSRASVDLGASPPSDAAAVSPDAPIVPDAPSAQDAASPQDAPALEDASMPSDDAGSSGDAGSSDGA